MLIFLLFRIQLIEVTLTWRVQFFFGKRLSHKRQIAIDTGVGNTFCIVVTLIYFLRHLQFLYSQMWLRIHGILLSL